MHSQRLIRFLKANPWLFKKFGDMADYAENALIEAATGKEWITRQAVKYEVNAMRKSLAGVRPTQLEIMGVDRLIAAWLLCSTFRCRPSSRTRSGDGPHSGCGSWSRPKRCIAWLWPR